MKQIENDTQFEEEVIQSDVPVFVDCLTEWCGPCKALKPILQELEDENKGKVKIALLDIEHNEKLAHRLNVTSVPKVVVFSNGEQVAEFVGLRPKQDYQAVLDGLHQKGEE